MDLSTLRERLDEELRLDAYAGVDASANGLQVGPDEKSVEHVAFAVDAAVETAEAAAAAGADLLVVHHGVSWGGIERVTGSEYDRVAALLDGDVALYAAHLPLDGHQQLGNAAGLADLLGLVDREPFAHLGGEPVGLSGRVPDGGVEAAALAGHLETDLDVGDGRVRTLDFGPERLQNVAVVTGSGADFLPEARDADVDCLLTGEGKQQLYHDAREAGITAILAGHYATETFGVRALQERVADWGPETTFVDAPTGL